jgi:hypothetical protein
LREEHRLMVFENRVLRHLLLYLGLRGTQQQGIDWSCLARFKLFDRSRPCVASCTVDRCMVICERTSLSHDSAHPLQTSYPVNGDKTLTSPQASFITPVNETAANCRYTDNKGKTVNYRNPWCVPTSERVWVPLSIGSTERNIVSYNTVEQRLLFALYTKRLFSCFLPAFFI